MGGDFLAKALDPEGPPPAQETLIGAKNEQVASGFFRLGPKIKIFERIYTRAPSWQLTP